MRPPDLLQQAVGSMYLVDIHRLRSAPWALLLILASVTAAQGADRQKITFTSTLDQTEQPAYLSVPDEVPTGEPRPLLVGLHSWSANFEQRNRLLEAEAAQRGWYLLCPNFRGPNIQPEACGSELAQQDILDAVEWMIERYPIDTSRIYLMGISGGGHMTMLMAARHPDRWAAASAWVGISDLAAWHQRHAKRQYGANLRAVCGGAPGESTEIDQQYAARSPLTHLQSGCAIPLDIAAGIHDGHTGSVPIRQSLDAFNAIAQAHGTAPISEEEIAQLSTPTGRLKHPKPSDVAEDPSFPRAIHLRRHCGDCRVTIFEGGHEGLPTAAVIWLEQFQKPPTETSDSP